MKKATIKRRKRIIPASQDEDGDENMENGKDAAQGQFDSRGSVNEDGSVSLGMRRRAEQQSLQGALRPDQRTPPLSNSDLAAYHQGSGQYRHAPDFSADYNVLPPMHAMSVAEDGHSTLSPYAQPRRKRSFSEAETDPSNRGEAGNQSPKRLSSIKSILNQPMTEGGHDRYGHYQSELSLPPIRSPGIPGHPNSSGHSSRSQTPQSMVQPNQPHESERLKLERRATLQREAERMREMLAANERELMDLGRD